jgi:hypothetical protein
VGVIGVVVVVLVVEEDNVIIVYGISFSFISHKDDDECGGVNGLQK